MERDAPHDVRADGRFELSASVARAFETCGPLEKPSGARIKIARLVRGRFYAKLPQDRSSLPVVSSASM